MRDPDNVLLIDEFSELFDGFSIGSSDLSQRTLCIDRDSEIVASSFDERDPGTLKMLPLAVEGAKRNARHSGTCGQAPSHQVEIACYLVELGIDTISLTPDPRASHHAGRVGDRARLRRHGGLRPP